MNVRVTSGGGCGAALLWALALAWCGGIVFFAVVIARSGAGVSLAAWATLAFFGLAGVYLLALAIRASLSAAALRTAAIDLRANVLGGKLAGDIHVPPGRFHLTLTNWRAGDMEELLWEATQTIAGSGPFAFDVPFDCEPTSAAASWRLILASIDGRHSASFTVPVERTAASSPAQTQRALRSAATFEKPPGTKVRVERGMAGTTVRLPLPSWVWRWYLIVIALAGGSYIAAMYIYRGDATTMYGVAVAAIIVLCAIPLPTLAMTVRRIDADRGGLTFHYVLPRRKRLGGVREIGAVYANGALHYELTFDGATPAWTIITLRSRAEADWVAYELAQRT